jgi:hypothetical protein
MRANGEKIPTALADQNFSGKFVVRIPGVGDRSSRARRQPEPTSLGAVGSLTERLRRSPLAKNERRCRAEPDKWKLRGRGDR